MRSASIRGTVIQGMRIVFSFVALTMPYSIPFRVNWWKCNGAKNSVLKFPSNALPARIDDFLLSMKMEQHQPLWMPVKLTYGGLLGAAPQAIQAIATWAQANSERILQLAPEYGRTKETQDRFAATLPGMTSLYFADRVESGQKVQSRFDALKAVAPLVRAMEAGSFRDTVRGTGAALVCFAGARSEYLNPLYSRSEPDAVRGNSEFRLLVRRILQAIGGGLVNAIDEKQVELLSSMVHQLFLNTDQHGAYDVSGRRYETGVRGIAIRVTSTNDLPSLIDDAGDDVPLRSYIAKASFLRTQDKEGEPRKAMPHHLMPRTPTRFLELSVFDTGPGLGLRWLSRKTGVQSYEDISEKAELEAVQECFQKHSTTKSVLNAGVGLHTALNAMGKLNAFMTLRTGRMSLYQDFSASRPHESFAPKPRRPKGQAAPCIAGTGFTICFKLS